MKQTSDKKNAPIFSEQLGSVRIAVWEATTDEDQVFHNTSITRSYKDKNGNWAESSSFNGIADLALIREGASLAIRFIQERERSLRNSAE